MWRRKTCRAGLYAPPLAHALGVPYLKHRRAEGPRLKVFAFHNRVNRRRVEGDPDHGSGQRLRGDGLKAFALPGKTYGARIIRTFIEVFIPSF